VVTDNYFDHGNHDVKSLVVMNIVEILLIWR
jgi:hypothetical protein